MEAITHTVHATTREVEREECIDLPFLFKVLEKKVAEREGRLLCLTAQEER
jgi:hypothetical protein